MEIGSRIRAIRESLGLSQQELASVLGVSQSSVSDAERNRGGLKAKFLLGLSAHTGKSVDWILRGDDESGEDSLHSPQLNSSKIPLFLVPAPAGATSPADDHVEQMVDMEGLTFSEKNDVFACRVVGDSMEGAGIHTGDTVIVERKEARPGDVVVCSVDGELTIKRLERVGDRTYLYPENPRYSPIEIRDGMSLTVWGVAIRIIKNLG